MGPAVHPDGPLAFERLTEPVDRDEAMRVRVSLFPCPRVSECPHLVWRGVAVALMMPKRQPRRIVRQGEQTAGLVDGDAAIIANLGPGAAIHAVFVEDR